MHEPIPMQDELSGDIEDLRLIVSNAISWLNPNDIEKIQGDNSRYAVVIGIAKRAREIAEQAEQEQTILLEKPVSMAIEDFESGDYKLVEEDHPEDEEEEE